MAITVTATTGGAGAATGIMLAVRVLNNASFTQNGATASSGSVTKPQIAITPHSTGSFIYGAVTYGTAALFTSILANTTSDYNAVDSTNGFNSGACRSTAVTASTSSATYGWGAPTVTAGNIGLGFAEILSNGGTLAEDASTPAVVYVTAGTAATSASFTPPSTSILVAMVSNDTNGSSLTTMALTDSGSAYTWTEVASCGPSFSPALDIASVWVGIPKLTTTGTFHEAALAFSGTSVETFTSTGTFHEASLAFAGTSTETFVSTGAFREAPVAFAGTVVTPLNVSSTGSMHMLGYGIGQTPLGILTEAGGGLVMEDGTEMVPEGQGGGVIVSGIFAQAALAFHGTSVETFASTGAFAEAPLAFQGTGVETFNSTGTFAEAPLAFNGTEVETITSTGAFALAALAMTGATTVQNFFTTTGSISPAASAFAGSVLVQNFFTSTGAFNEAPLAFTGAGSNVIVSTGSMHLASLAVTGTSVETFNSTGSMSQAALAFHGAEIETIQATGAFHLSVLAFAATATQTIPNVSSSGSISLAALAFEGFPPGTNNTFGTTSMPGMSMSGAVVNTPPNIATSGSFGTAKTGFAGQVIAGSTSFGRYVLGTLKMSGTSIVAPPIAATGSMHLAAIAMLGATGEIVRPVVSDAAAIKDTALVIVRVFVNDYAGVVEAPVSMEEGVAVSVPDFVAMAETVTVHVVAGVHDYATMQEFDHAINEITPSVTVSSTFSAYSSMEESISSTFTVGKPFQSSNRQIALARWNFMYPS